ncbi:MAG: OsmC family protein [Gammaproteobacteria bacterium]|nr:OsmC family protein [Gammaproteobacteria bacterium]
MAHAIADIGTSDYAVALVAGSHPLTADEGPARGGKDLGPTPHELVCAGLAACTAITLRMYAERKNWPLSSVHVDVDLTIEGTQRLITRRLRLAGALDQSQRARLADIAERTPVTLTLKQGATISTILE